MFCGVCNGLFSQPRPFDAWRSAEPISIAHTRASFERSIQVGCHLCNLIYRSMAGWPYISTGKRTLRYRQAGDPVIPPDLDLRCAFRPSFRYPDQGSYLRTELAKLCQLLQCESNKTIRPFLEEHQVGMRMEIWQQGESSNISSLVMRPVEGHPPDPVSFLR